MQPDQQLPPPMYSGGSQQSPYDFIFDSKAPKQSRIPGIGGGSKQQQLLLIAIIGGAVALVAVIVMIFFSGGSGAEGLMKIAQQQNELIRIGTLAEQQARGRDTRNLAVNVRLTIASNQKDTLNYIQKNTKQKKVDPAVLKQTRDAKTDKALEAAQQAGQFDEVFTETMQRELTEYQTMLHQENQTTEAKTGKTLLTSLNAQAAALLKDTQQ